MSDPSALQRLIAEMRQALEDGWDWRISAWADQLDALLVRRDDGAIREAFEEGFALSKFNGSISAAWERSEARQAAALSDPVVRPAREWQPIATAPKDGTPILAFIGGQVSTGYYSVKSHQWFICGWYGPPTHWMPLPQPPNVLPAPPGLAREAQTAHDTDQPV